MSEKMLRRILVLGTLLFFLILGAMTVDSLSQVASARTAQLTDQVVAGKQVWQSKNCNDCHTILGIGGYYAPELTKTFNRRGGAWLSAWLKDPQKVLPGATMPIQNLSDQQASDLVAFFQWVSLVDTNNWPPAPLGAQAVANPALTSPPPTQPTGTANSVPGAGTAAPTNTPSILGSAVFQNKGCSACHTINGQGGQSGPDLTHIATQPYDALPNTPEFMTKWLENPQAQKPDTLMPAIPMSTAERDALVQYLMSLK